VLAPCRRRVRETGTGGSNPLAPTTTAVELSTDQKLLRFPLKTPSLITPGSGGQASVRAATGSHLRLGSAIAHAETGKTRIAHAKQTGVFRSTDIQPAEFNRLLTLLEGSFLQKRKQHPLAPSADAHLRWGAFSCESYFGPTIDCTDKRTKVRFSPRKRSPVAACRKSAIGPTSAIARLLRQAAAWA
jgi:hypothetical protein